MVFQPKKKDGILFTADMHLRDDVPTCRTDKFLETQWAKLKVISDYTKKNNLWWVDCGDVFHKARPSYHLVNDVISRLKSWQTPIDAAIYGNHDMPAHTRQNFDDCAFGTLVCSGIIRHAFWGESVLFPCTWGNVQVWGVNYGESCFAPDNNSAMNVLVMHDMFFHNKNDIPGVDGHIALDFAQEWGQCYRYIFTGHNHKSLSVSNSKWELHNIGSMTRQTVDLIDHKPRFSVLDKSGVYHVNFKIDGNAVSRKHIEKKEAEEDQLAAFVESLGNNEEVSLNFEGNVQIVLNKVKPSPQVKIKVQGAME